ncbi:copia protein [Dermatophagoides farinae]|uniref:Copia protein n=1 Tax=Dermatophagoides farinae TaxID=6954 RepID=A0A9D4NVG2_DERFA|nr:copia protein [Dermatophagoides farinae]
MVGYNGSNIYRVYCPDRRCIKLSSSVKFDETSKCRLKSVEVESNSGTIVNIGEKSDDDEKSSQNAENEEDNDHEPEATTSTNRGRPIGSTNRKYTVCEERLKTLQNFELKILKPGNYLGLEFRQDKSKREIYVCQKSYILLKLKQFNLDNSKTMNTPISSTNDWYLESTRAKCIIDSTCEAEYIATSKCSKDIQWLLILMDYLRLTIPKPIIFNDNQAAIRQIHGEVVSQKLRHIDVKFHRIRSLLGKVDVEYIQSSQQLADILTKALSTQLHQNLIDKLFKVLVAE